MYDGVVTDCAKAMGYHHNTSGAGSYVPTNADSANTVRTMFETAQGNERSNCPNGAARLDSAGEKQTIRAWTHVENRRHVRFDVRTAARYAGRTNRQAPLGRQHRTVLIAQERNADRRVVGQGGTRPQHDEERRERDSHSRRG